MAGNILSNIVHINDQRQGSLKITYLKKNGRYFLDFFGSKYPPKLPPDENSLHTPVYGSCCAYKIKYQLLGQS